jgi:hypothetical protein
VSEVVPLVAVDGRALRDAKPGARTLALQSAYRTQAARSG